MAQNDTDEWTGSEIAIIGMSGRFPGANNIDIFWRNLRDGVESLTRLTDAELLAAGVDPTELSDPNYVKVAPVIDDIELFDAAFFGFSPLEAEITDPQQRIFTECVWEALEDAGYNPDTYPHRMGVFAGSRTNTYVFNIVSNPHLFKSLGVVPVSIGNDLASLATRVSYKLDLKGPSYALHTACSTSLVAVHLARQSLLLDECQIAVAGGVVIGVPHRVGYRYESGGVFSPDGQCRAFDIQAQGTIFGNGAGVVVLKRLEDALGDGDHIYAIIKGSATNNDGAVKASFTAPSVDGQAAVIMDALADAEVAPDTISYVETHGTGTALGDPIEIRALTKAFQSQTNRKNFCRIGSVKTNIGHLDAAAGISSLIKTVLALYHRQIPPSLHYTAPNPRIDFANSPFYVNTSLADWEQNIEPRRAGVSSFGFGGTNSHVILEEAPPQEPSDPAHPWKLLVLSARSSTALDRQTNNLVAYLHANPDANLADVAYTLQIGRRLFTHRRVLVCHDHAGALEQLEGRKPGMITQEQSSVKRPVVFMFSGQGAQHTGMAGELYRDEPVFREWVDRCAELLKPYLGMDLCKLLYSDPTTDDSSTSSPGPHHSVPSTPYLDQTRYAQVALFVIEYALAQLWMSWGLVPQALIGHSIGEYVAATLAGVMRVEDALVLVTARGHLMQSLSAGAMLSVSLPEEDVLSLLDGSINLAAVNSFEQCVVSGPNDAIAALERRLGEQEIGCRRLHTSHAFHSAMMDPILDSFADEVRKVRLSAPRIPFISNVSGTWITTEQSTDTQYWVRHLRQPVRFAAGLQEILQQNPARLLLEVGPGTTLSTFARRQPSVQVVVASLRHPQDERSDGECLMLALGQVWQAGVPIDWTKIVADERRQRISLPTYPFERQRYWIEAGTLAPLTERRAMPSKKPNLVEWFYLPSWQEAPLTPVDDADSWGRQRRCWLLFADDCGLVDALAAHLEMAGQDVFRVLLGAQFDQPDARTFTLDPRRPEDYDRLLRVLKDLLLCPSRIVHAWSVTSEPDVDVTHERFASTQNHGFYSLVFLTQALMRAHINDPIQIELFSTYVQQVRDDDRLSPAKATVLGPCRVIPQEHLTIACRSIDVDLPEVGTPDRERLVSALLDELRAPVTDTTVTYRSGRRLVQTFVPAPDITGVRQTQIRQGGVYLITGGLGRLGLLIGEYLARTYQARLVLVGRTALPPRAEWAEWIQAHDDDPMSRRLLGVQALEAAGGEVLALDAEVSDAEQLRAVVAQAHARFGPINGVLHAAGLTHDADYAPVQSIDHDTCERHFRSKALGLIALEQALVDEPLDFWLLFSSLASVLGGLSYVAYAAANLYLDAAGRRARVGGPAWLCVNWDSWHQETVRGALGTTLVDLAISPIEGMVALEHVLARGASQLVVSTGDLQPRIHQWIRLEALRATQISTSSDGPGTLLPRVELESKLVSIWQRVLGVRKVGLHDNFFDLGGDSLSGIQLISEVKRELHVQLAPVTLFEAPNISALVKYLSPDVAQPLPKTPSRSERLPRPANEHSPIAIIGMDGRFPGARDIASFWHNLSAGRETITFFSDEELLAAGVTKEQLSDPTYVKARPVLDGAELFDAAFFGYSPREADLMDPQHRVFLEVAWHALEHAGYSRPDAAERIGVFGGANLSTYLLNLYSNRDLIDSIDPLQTAIGNAQDSLATSVSYKLNLKGPSVTVQTFCSTSLVAVHLACQSLLNDECDLALAGGITILVPQESGYRYQEGSILSPDGHSRAFDAQAQGTLFGSGVGIVVLKALDAALADGDTIYAVIRGSAINNDGSLKAGYTAPSVEGQVEVIANALSNAAVDAESISYVEAHGTGTALGDPIEIAALTRAYRRQTDRTGYCAIGSVKGNIGHADRAAGIASLIKTVLALQHRQIPPSLHYSVANPQIDFASSPFFVNTTLTDWTTNSTPRRAGVSSLGFGGTNAHVILEEAPASSGTSSSRPWQLLLLSAKSAIALDALSVNLTAHLRATPDINLADVAYTLQIGRWPFMHRRAVVCHDSADAVQAIEIRDGRRVFDRVQEARERPIAFLFPGQGAQYVRMGLELYRGEPVFREWVDRCADLLKPHLDLDLREVLYPDLINDQRPKDAESFTHSPGELDQTWLTQPALFVVEYALAQLWLSWGVHPQALIGHSLGEYVAACLADVMSLEDALTLVTERGRLMQSLPPGAMVSVAIGPAALETLLTADLSLAAVNGPERCTVAGPSAAIEAFVQHLAVTGVHCQRLTTERAFHSPMVEAVLSAFQAAVARVRLRPAQIPIVSNVTGTWLTDEQATNPAYWTRQMRAPVLFAAGLDDLLQMPGRVLLEVGPGQVLSSLAQKLPSLRSDHAVIATMRRSQDQRDDQAVLIAALGQLALVGASIDWLGFYNGERRQRIALPGYPFERQRHWVDADYTILTGGHSEPRARLAPESWLHTLGWNRSRLPQPAEAAQNGALHVWLVFADDDPLSDALIAALRQSMVRVITVHPGDRFQNIGIDAYALNPQQAHDYTALVSALEHSGQRIDKVIHLWSTVTLDGGDDNSHLAAVQDAGFLSLLFLARSLDQAAVSPLPIWAVTQTIHDVVGDEVLIPARAIIPAACLAIARRYGGVLCYIIDIVPTSDRNRLVEQVLGEVCARSPVGLVAYRGSQRWLPTFVPASGHADRPVLDDGAFLVFGGLEQPGIQIVSYLARVGATQMTLVDAEGLPSRDAWAEWLNEPTTAQRAALASAIVARRKLLFDLVDQQSTINHLEERVLQEAEQLVPPSDLERDLDALCAISICDYLASQIVIRSGASYNRHDLQQSLNILPKYARFFAFMLDTLVANGIADLHDDMLTFKHTPVAAAQMHATLSHSYPESVEGFAVLEHCVRGYGAVLSGQADPFSILYPNGDSAMIRTLEASQSRFSNLQMLRTLLGQVIAQIAHQTCGRRLKILEVGAGEGNLTWEIAAALLPYNVDYYVTDAARLFVLQAEKRAAEEAFDFMRFGVLDITQDPCEQGLAASDFDLVLACAVIHATPSIEVTLHNLRRLLAPGGILAIIEATRSERWTTMVWGMLDIWWHATDQRPHPDSPLLGFQHWETLLGQQGFRHVGIYPAPGMLRARADYALMLLQEYERLDDDCMMIAQQAVLTATRNKIQQVQALEVLGVNVQLITAAFADSVQLRAVVEQTRHHHGSLAGVVYVAPTVVNTSASTTRDVMRVLHATRDRLYALEQALASERLTHAFLIASGPARWDDGNLAARAAIDYQASLARAILSRGGQHWTSVEWQISDTALPQAVQTMLDALFASDADDVLLLDQVLPSTWNSPIPPQQAVEQRRSDMRLHPRPHGLGLYVAPKDTIQSTLVQIWQDLLGIDQIGTQDEFLLLGGDSLQATQLLSRMRDAFQVDISLKTFFTTPTVAGLADAIAELQAQQEDRDVQEIMAMMEALSDEAVLAEIEKRRHMLDALSDNR